MGLSLEHFSDDQICKLFLSISAVSGLVLQNLSLLLATLVDRSSAMATGKRLHDFVKHC